MRLTTRLSPTVFTLYTISNLTVDAIVYFIIVLLVVGFPMVAPPRPVAPHVNPAFFPDMQSGTTSVVRRNMVV